MRNLEHIECDFSTLEKILERAVMTEEDRATIRAAIDTLALVTRELEAKRVSIGRLQRIIFGAQTEKTDRVLGTPTEESQPSPPEGDSAPPGGAPPPRRKGHGRNGASAYVGAKRVSVPHPCLHVGDSCPDCESGKLYALEPRQLVRITGQAPIVAKVHECSRLRCKNCGKVFAAEAPSDVGDEKYDVGSAVMIAVLKYGIGLPFYRLGRLQQALNIPLPPSTQWGIVHARIRGPEAAYLELVKQGAQASLVHNDDTYATLLGPVRRKIANDTSRPPPENNSDRTGTFTSGIVAIHEGRHIVLFFTGHQHAGENLRDVLQHRAADLEPPLHMCDALSRNLPKEFQTILCNCLAHARRSFVDVAPRFREECRHVLESLRDVYRNDERARKRNMSPQERLAWHQEHSAPIMEGLRKWFKEQFDHKTIEPNSTLGDAIKYMQRHWHELTQFLRVVGAPLDNNVVERVLKRAILHRKNAMFFRTERGAHVGDVYMSLIHTAEQCGANPIDYLTALMVHADRVVATPGEWLPWNYRQQVVPVAA